MGSMISGVNLTAKLLLWRIDYYDKCTWSRFTGSFPTPMSPGASGLIMRRMK